MKTKIKRHSRSALSVVLAVCMLVSCLTVGIIATDAAKTEGKSTGAKVDSEAVGENITNMDYAYVYGSFNSSGDWTSSWNSFGMSTSDKNIFEKSIYLKAGYNYEFKIIAGKRNTWEHKYGLNSSTGFTFTSSSTFYQTLTQRDNVGYNFGLTTTSATSGYVKVNFWFKGSHSSDSQLSVTQEAVNSVVSAADKTINDAKGGESKNVAPTTTGGSGSYTYSYVVKDNMGTVLNDVMSGNNFTVPYVTANKTYTITATVTDANIPSLVDTATITVNAIPKESDWVVAGTRNLTGYTWDNTKNKMTQVASDTFTFTFQNVADSNDVFEFKISAYDNWNSAVGYNEVSTAANRVLSGNAATGTLENSGGNFKFDTNAAANITITFVDNSENANKKMTVNADNATAYTLTVNESNTSRRDAAPTDSPATKYQGTGVTITTSPKSGYKAVLTSLKDASNNNVAYTRSGNNFHFNMPASNVTANVDYVEALAVPLTVYANSGGEVRITYGTAVTTVSSGEHATIRVSEGASVNITAIPAEDYTFSKWHKNLNTDYSSTAALTSEIINDKTVYVANFAEEAGSSSEEGIAVGSYKMVYKIGSINNPTELSEKATIYRLGDRLVAYLDYDDVTGKNVYFAFSNSDSYSGIVNKSSSLTVAAANGSESNVKAKKVDGWDGGTQYYYGMAYDWSGGVSGSKVMFDLAPATGTGSTSGYGSVTGYTVAVSSSGSTPSPVAEDYLSTVNFYAKDSAFSSQSEAEITYMGSLDTTVTEVADQVDVDSEASSGKNYETGLALKGSQITVTTTIPTTGSLTATGSSGNVTVTPAQKYYVVGFSFNGITPVILQENDTGVYECTYTIPENMTEKILEITPIYFIRSAYASNTAIFYLNGYDDTVKTAGWGNTLFVYPFYKYYKSGSSGDKTTYEGKAENFGAYPGQPVVNNGGQLYTQIPLTCNGTANGVDTGGNPIKGVTINNGYFDNVHKAKCNFVNVHRQTYDYDDFAKIYNEKKLKDGNKYLHSIYFSFKYHSEDPTNQHRSYNTTSSRNNENEKDRYNDMMASGRPGDNPTATTLETYGNSPGWEQLTDSLGNPVDLFGNKVTNTSADPLKVISMGYEFNNSGQYATEWAVYHKNGSNYDLIYDSTNSVDSTNADKAHNSSIVPSALVMNSESSFANYVAMDGDQSIQGYEKLYTALKDYAGYPVEISYEYDAYIAYNNPHAYRSDGRWTYTTVNDFVKSNIVIEYYDSNGELQTETNIDDDHVGRVTGTKAYFTNTEYYGKMTSDSELISNDDRYTFEAEAAGSYEFDGWYLYDTSDKVSTITQSSLSASTLKSGNFKIAARFRYVASGYLYISNVLASGSTGRADTYLGVKLVNGSEETILSNINSNKDAVKIDKAYINSNSNYEIVVDIRTVPKGENLFASYACNTTNGSDVKAAASDTDIYDSTNSGNSTDTYTIQVKRDIYNNTTTQVVKAIEYVSALTPVNYTYSIKYNYTSRSYGDQAFTQEGTLTAGQIEDTNVVTGTLNKADKMLTKDFIANKIAPHESNFNEKISWNIDSVYSNQSCNYNSSTNTYAITLVVPLEAASTTSTVTRTAYFTVPYELAASKTGVANIHNDETDPNNIFAYVEKAVADQTFTVSSTYGQLLKDSDNKYITAPEKMYIGTVNGEKKYQFFQKWEFKNMKNQVVGHCYYPEFNYLLYENYQIEAVYGDTKVSYGNLFAADTSTTISFIGNSRNQWNKGDNGTNTNYAGDMIYNDFIISYRPGGNTLIKDIEGAQTGIIIQRLDQVTLNSSGKNSMTLDEYASKFTSEQLTTAKNAATSAVTESGTYDSIQCVKQPITTSNINDKNRIHYAYKMYNTRQAEENGAVSTPSSKMYFYRVYSYMVVNETTYVSDTPTYFCMYDIATE